MRGVSSCLAMLVMLPVASSAQGQAGPGGPDEEIFVDPELQGAPAPGGVGSTGEVIDDPELTGQDRQSSVGIGLAPPPQPVPNGRVSVVLRSRAALDLSFDDPREDVWATTQLAQLEAVIKRSEELRFVVGTRLLHRASGYEGATADTEPVKLALDAIPSNAYADLRLAEGLHLRLGYQSQYLGRFDLFTATNILMVADLREGPATLPEAAEVAQLGARLDWDLTPALSLRLLYVPFFLPHLLTLQDGDYALSPSTQAQTTALFQLLGAAGADMPERAQALLRQSFSRAARTGIVQSGFDAFAHDPDLTTPQAAARLSLRAGAGELGLTLGTALEKLPALRASDALAAYLADSSAENEDRLLADPQPLTIDYQRFLLISVDGATELGPVLVGAEVAYSLDRTLIAAAEGLVSVPERADLLHLGLRAQYLVGTRLLAVAEGFFNHTMGRPQTAGAGFLGLIAGRWTWGVAGLLRYGLTDFLAAELGAAFVAVDTYALLPRVEWRLAQGLHLELGAQLLGGRDPERTRLPELSLGGVYEGSDQVFVGLRFEG